MPKRSALERGVQQREDDQRLGQIVRRLKQDALQDAQDALLDFLNFRPTPRDEADTPRSIGEFLRQMLQWYARRPDVDDLYQAVSLNLWRNRAGVRDGLVFPKYFAYTGRAVRNLFYDELRRNARDRSIGDLSNQTPDDHGAAATATLISIDFKGILGDALYEVVYLRYGLELSAADVADIVGLSVHQVYDLCDRAKRLLRETGGNYYELS